MKKFVLLLLLVAGSVTMYSQQYVWAKNGGAGALINPTASLSPTLNASASAGVAQNETWAVFTSGSSTKFSGSGNGSTPDIGSFEKQGSYFGRYDANMNLVWYSDLPANATTSNTWIAADPRANDQFYMVVTVGGVSGSWKGFSWSGHLGGGSILLLKCKAGSAPYSVTVLWGRKIDGTSNNFANTLRVKDIGSGHTRIVVSGGTNSSSIANYTDAANGVAQTAPVDVTISGPQYEAFASCYDEDVNGGIVTPLWINTFGTSGVDNGYYSPIEISDEGSVQWLVGWKKNTLGTVNYSFNNSSGSGTGTVSTTNYNVNINTDNRYILFSFDGSNGTPA